MAHSELGDQLRRARENKGFSLEEAEKATGIRKRFLQAMEEGRFDALPGPVQVHGFLKSYAGCLGLSAEEILASYERETRSAQTAAALKSASPARPVAVRPTPPPPKLQPAKPAAMTPQPTQPVTPPPSIPSQPQPAPAPQPVVTPSQPQPQPAKPKPPAAKPPAALPARSFRLPPWLTVETGLIALAAILVLCVGALAAFVFLGPRLSKPAPAPRPTATRTAQATTPLPTIPPATPTVMPLSQITTSVRTTGTTGYVQVALAATEHVWVRVSTDGTTAFEGMFAPGQALNWEAKELLIVEASNGAGLTASYNGKPVGVLGQRGQIVARAWTPAGEAALPSTPTVPAPAPSPTP